jgi:hypothetical protein
MVMVIGVFGGSPPPNAGIWKPGKLELKGPMFAPVLSVNSSISPTPGAATLTSADAEVSTSMNVLTSNALPPHVFASVFCCLSRTIAGDLLVMGPCCGTTAPWVPAG